jgi:hypothetical protein
MQFGGVFHRQVQRLVEDGRSELVSLQIRDIQIGEAGLVVTLRRSKINQEDAHSIKGIPAGTRDAMCPKSPCKCGCRRPQLRQAHSLRPVEH